MSATAKTVSERAETASSWPKRFGEEEWALYKGVIQEARRRGLPFAIGGGLAAMTYAGQWRNTKDLDFYILPRDREAMIDVLNHFGLQDYYDRQPYDRNWIYRGCKDGNIVDIMWAMANQRAVAEESWLAGPEVEADGERFRLLPPEEALWTKLYIVQRDRADWPDAMNVLYGVGPQMDWRRLLPKLGPDKELLAALLSCFGWLCPERARELPAWLWNELGITRPRAQGGLDLTRERARLLDSRPWFTPTLPKDDERISNLQISIESKEP